MRLVTEILELARAFCDPQKDILELDRELCLMHGVALGAIADEVQELLRASSTLVAEINRLRSENARLQIKLAGADPDAKVVPFPFSRLPSCDPSPAPGGGHAA